jgi:hypothetical protein
VVRGKERLKGSKGNGENDGVTGMRITFKISYIAVVILHFLIYLGTRQNPSLLEFTSIVPAVLGSGPPAMQTAVVDFIASLSTTQLGFERTVVSITHIYQGQYQNASVSMQQKPTSQATLVELLY